MPRSSSEFVSVERPRTNSRVFAHTRWDAIPVAAALLHCAYFFGMFYLFPRVPLWVMFILGFIYSVSISWNINGISHNFIHNPLLPFAATQSSVQYHGIYHSWFQPDFLRMHSYAASQKQRGPPQ